MEASSCCAATHSSHPTPMRIYMVAGREWTSSSEHLSEAKVNRILIATEEDAFVMVLKMNEYSENMTG